MQAFVTLTIHITLITLLSACSLTPTKTSRWEDTVSRVSSGVVTIQTDSPIAFDGLWNASSAATGFVVDSERGIILTNRHVVTAGPVTARAIFINNEEVTLRAIYRDPVHDFGFYQYQPKDLKHLTPHNFQLNPEGAQVGLAIRVIGNDDGQKLSIHGGTISRIDRDAPIYKAWTYTDFNTYYIQAASGTTSGASGSPVINLQGEVIALNAGSRVKSANAFYLPLQQISKTLKALQQGEPFARGTIQATYTIKPYAELKRLGFTKTQESQFRKQHPKLKGKLVIDAIIPESPAAKVLQVGDILSKINGKTLTNFVDIESLLNASVDKNINIELIRDGQVNTVKAPVFDLHKFTPGAYVSFDNGIFHNLSYQQARYFNKPIEGVYIANSSKGFHYSNIPRHSVITQINDEPIRNLEDFTRALLKLQDKEKAHVRYFSKSAPHITRYALAEFNHKWFSSQTCERRDDLGYWPCSPLELPDSNTQVQTIADEVIEHAKQQLIAAQKHPEKIAANTADSLALVKFNMPYPMHGISNWSKQTSGTGIIVDAARGRIITDRATVPSSLGNVKITFFNTIEISGRVEYIHPHHNLSIVSYDPSLLSGLKLRAARFSRSPPTRGDTVTQVGLDGAGQLQSRETTIDTIDAFHLGYSNIPRFRDQNIDVIELANARYDIDGPLLNHSGEIIAYWGSFQGTKDWTMAGIPAEIIQEFITVEANDSTIRSLEIELGKITIVEALDRGLPSEWLERMRGSHASIGRFLTIIKVAADTPSSAVFQPGDVLLAIDNQMLSSFREVEELSQHEQINVVIFREGMIIKDKVATTQMKRHDIDHMVNWSGASLHAPHRAVAMQLGLSTKGVWITQYWYGSPASRYKLHATNRIIDIDGVTINNLDDLIKAVKDKQHQQSLKIKILNLKNKERVITLNTDNYYWPLFEVKREGKQWQKISHPTQLQAHINEN